MTDIAVQYDVVGATLYAETEEALAWLSEELGEPEGMESAWHVEEEFVENILDLAKGEGLTVTVRT